MTETLVDRIESRLSKFVDSHADDPSAIANSATKLFDGSRIIEDSWSGSFAGWHATMYFGDFNKPPVQKRFNGEWGGIHGIPVGWDEKSTEAVTAQLETLIGDGFSSKGFEAQIKTFRSELRDLSQELSLWVAELSISQSPKATELLDQVVGATFEDTKGKYAAERMPSGLWSRDSEAVRQGIRLPDWLYFQAVAADARSLIDAFSDYRKRLALVLELAGKPIEEPGSKTPQELGRMPLHPTVIEKCAALYNAGTYAEAVEKSFKTVRDRLRQLTGFERGADAFGRGNLHVKGAAATNVDHDFNEAVKFLLMAIDNFRNEKSHTSDGNISDPERALQYLAMSSLALALLDQAEIRP